jgi:hypothetical protein
VLEGARAARTAPGASEAAVLEALTVAPDDRAVRMGAYKFYFYDGRLAEAVPHAEWCIAAAARDLDLPVDWRAVAPGAAAFDGYDEEPRLFLQSLIAWGYCKARLGDLTAGLEALAKAVELDPADKFGAARLAAVIRRRGDDEEA